jgi:hypothetical protein
VVSKLPVISPRENSNACVEGVANEARGDGRVPRLNAEAFAQRRVGHGLVQHVAQAGVLVAGAQALGPVHLGKRAVSEQHRARRTVGHLEKRRRELEHLGLRDDLVDAAATLLANAHTARQ